jgi:predicted metal-binding membrane protein
VLQTQPLSRERWLILVILLALAAGAWLVLFGQSTLGEGMPTRPTMGMTAPLFLALWVVMMAAMMFPTAAPMILVFARVHENRRQRGTAFVPTWVFVAAYLLVWTAFGALMYSLALAAEALASSSLTITENARRAGGVLLILAGLYQLSPLKNLCLSKCRGPLEFVMQRWADGYAGAFLMGLKHGAYCLGCCWLLFVILFPLGVMNVVAMAFITLLIFAEKSLPGGRRIGQIAAVALVAYGALVLALPEALPTTMPGGDAM